MSIMFSYKNVHLPASLAKKAIKYYNSVVREITSTTQKLITYVNRKLSNIKRFYLFILLDEMTNECCWYNNDIVILMLKKYFKGRTQTKNHKYQ